MIIFIYLLFTFLDRASLFLLWDSYFKRKHWALSKLTCFCILSLNVGLYFFMAIYLGSDTVINVLFIVATTCLICVISYEGSFVKKILITLLCMVLILLMDVITYLVVTMGYGVNISDLKDSVLYFISYAANLLIRIMVFLLINKIDKRRNVQQQNILYLLQSIIPLLSVVFLYFYFAYVLAKEDLNQLQNYGVILLVLILNAAHYTIFYHQEKLAAENYENKLLIMEYKYWDDYYRNVEKCQEEIRLLRHDLKNQLISINADVITNRSHESIKDMIDSINEMEQEDFTQNAGINALLNAKLREAKNVDIRCNFDVKLPETMNFELRDMAAMLGNLLDNAIEACINCSLRYIHLKLIYFNNALIVHVENAAEYKVTSFITRKTDPYNHGFGMKSIMSVVKKYNGVCQHKATSNSFQMNITLWEPKNR